MYGALSRLRWKYTCPRQAALSRLLMSKGTRFFRSEMVYFADFDYDNGHVCRSEVGWVLWVLAKAFTWR